MIETGLTIIKKKASSVIGVTHISLKYLKKTGELKPYFSLTVIPSLVFLVI